MFRPGDKLILKDMLDQPLVAWRFTFVRYGTDARNQAFHGLNGREYDCTITWVGSADPMRASSENFWYADGRHVLIEIDVQTI